MPVATAKLETILDKNNYISELIDTITQSLLPQFNILALDRAVYTYEQVSNRLSAGKKRQNLERILKERGTKVIALYDAHLITSNQSFSQLVFDTFQSISSNADCALIIVGDYQIRDLQDASSTFLGSSTFIHFPVYNPYTNEEHKIAWKNIIGSLIETLPDKYSKAIINMDTEVLSRSLGSYGLLIDWIKKSIRFKQKERNRKKSFQECLVHTQKNDTQLLSIQNDINGFIQEQENKELKIELRKKQSASKEVQINKKRNPRPGKSNSGERITAGRD